MRVDLLTEECVQLLITLSNALNLSCPQRAYTSLCSGSGGLAVRQEQAWFLILSQRRTLVVVTLTATSLRLASLELLETTVLAAWVIRYPKGAAYTSLASFFFCCCIRASHCDALLSSSQLLQQRKLHAQVTLNCLRILPEDDLDIRLLLETVLTWKRALLFLPHFGSLRSWLSNHMASRVAAILFTLCCRVLKYPGTATQLPQLCAAQTVFGSTCHKFLSQEY